MSSSFLEAATSRSTDATSAKKKKRITVDRFSHNPTNRNFLPMLFESD